MVLLQEDKYKYYYNQLKYALEDYDRIVHKIYPVTERLLLPAVKSMELKMKPGLVTLTWMSVNIDAFCDSIHQCMQRLEDLINKMNDIVDNRISKNLKLISRMILVDFPQVRPTFPPLLDLWSVPSIYSPPLRAVYH